MEKLVQVKDTKTTSELETAVFDYARSCQLSLNSRRYLGETYAGMARVLRHRASDIQDYFGVGGRYTDVVINAEDLAGVLEQAEDRWFEIEEGRA